MTRPAARLRGADRDPSRAAGVRPDGAGRGASPRAPRGAGFTFLEILVVMALAAVVVGLGVGFIVNAGKATRAAQAAEMVSEAGRRCLNMSAGGRRAALEIREVDVEGSRILQVQTAVQRTVLTANFESDPEFLVHANEPTIAKATGTVRIDPAGKAGSCAVFGSGGIVEYGDRSAFAMTDGVEVVAWVKPDPSGRDMALITAEGGGQVTWVLRLSASAGRSAAFEVRFEVSEAVETTGATREATAGPRRTFFSSPGAVLGGVWSEVRVSYDGRDATIEVNGVDRLRPDPARRGEARPHRRLHVPPGGTVRLFTGPTYVGALDTLNVAGVFRNDEDVRRMPLGVTLFRTPSPTRIVFANGRLDPTLHRTDVEVRLQGPGDGELGSYTSIRFGLYGSLTSPTFSPGASAAPQEAPR